MTKHAQDLAPSLVQPSRKKIPLVLKVFGILLIVVGSLTVATIALSAFGISEGFTKSLSDYDTTTLVIFGVEVALTAVSGVLYIALGVYLLRNKRRLARHALETLIILDISLFLCDVMVYGFSLQGIIASLIRLVLAIALMVYIDPSLSEERELRRKLRDMETRERAEEGTLGRDETGKGYIELDFFNLFWIFVVCCVLGLLIETVYHAIVFGGYQDRAGVLYGPFSPIYGFGAVLMTVALNRFHNCDHLLGKRDYRRRLRIPDELVHAVRLRHRGVGLHRNLPFHRRPHELRVHVHVGSPRLPMGQVAFAAHAQARQHDSLELALQRHHRMRRAHDRERRHDFVRPGLLVPARSRP